MQLQIGEYTLPQAITFNYDEIKTELSAKVEMYKTLVYTEDQVSSAKKDRANLNAFKKSLNDERIRLEKEYLEPFNDFKAKVNDLIKIVDEPVGIIDKQVKAFEDKKKDEKREQIKELWAKTDKPDWLTLEKIWDEKWLNASVTMKQVSDAIANTLARIANELSIVDSLPHPEEARIIYEQTLDLAASNAESARIAEIQKAVEAKKIAEEPKEEPTVLDEIIDEQKIKVQFECEITPTQAKKLSAFCKENGIVLKKI